MGALPVEVGGSDQGRADMSGWQFWIEGEISGCGGTSFLKCFAWVSEAGLGEEEVGVGDPGLG